jgi:hypothetical protein
MRAAEPEEAVAVNPAAVNPAVVNREAVSPVVVVSPKAVVVVVSPKAAAAGRARRAALKRRPTWAIRPLRKALTPFSTRNKARPFAEPRARITCPAAPPGAVSLH